MFEEVFRLISLTIANHKVLGDNKFVFDNDYGLNDQQEDIYSTVIIGANGIGKSFLLKVIVDIFNYIYDINTDAVIPRSLGYNFIIQYRCNGYLFQVGNINEGQVQINARLVDKLACYKDGNSIGVHNCLLPNVVVASAMTVSDKFVIRGEQDLGSMYRYQGIRNEKSPSTTGTRTLVRKTVNGLIKCLKYKGGFRNEIALLLDVLNFKKTLKIRYSLRYTSVFLNPEYQMTPKRLIHIFDNRKVYFERRTTELWGKRYFDKIRNDKDKLEIICEFYNRVQHDDDIKKNHWCIEYDVFEDIIERDADAIALLTALDLISFPTLLVEKNQQYDFADSSSGETHLLCQMIGIMSVIKRGGLILVDEPETSSHPNWQIQYMSWLREIFKSYSSCHFIVSTHSHFILSDLKPDSSTIIALERDTKGRLINIGEELNTFCWSTDDILYRVFHVRNTRNRAFEDDIMKLCKMLSDGENDINAVETLMESLSRYRLPGNDPLLVLINHAQEYVKARKTI